MKPNTTNSILRAHGLTKRFGGVTAVDNCSLEVQEQSILGIIGPNGAGKTTLLNLINRVYKPDAGDVYFRNERITGLRPHEIARRGIGRLFQVPRVFRKMTLLENMLVPSFLLNEKRDRTVDKAIKLLERFNLVDLRNEHAEALSTGQQRLLEFARVLMADPELILLDEPFAGVHPEVKKSAIDFITQIRKGGKTFILISHDIPSIMGVCQEIIVINQGRIIARGKPEEIQRDENVIEAYLGV